MDGGAIALMSESERAFDYLAEYPGVIVSRSQSDCNACVPLSVKFIKS
jgi:hypothetical protein